MNAIDYNKKMFEEIQKNGAAGKKLLLHACCAPCSTACLERLKGLMDITVLFYNPNIETEEYLKRKAEIVRFLSETGWADFLDCDHQKEAYYAAVKGIEGEREGGAIAQTAAANGIPFAVVRSVSDGGDSAAAMDYPTFKKTAAEKSTAIILKYLEGEKTQLEFTPQ